jgi:NAD(P)H-flavin reductase
MSNSSASKTISEQVPLLESDDPELYDTEQTSAKPAADANFMNFLIRPYDSFTGRLQELTTKNGQTAAALRMVVEGPYGTSQPLHKFDRVLFIVGGSGIVVPLSYLKFLSSGAQRTISTHVHWAVREATFATEVLTNDMADTIDDDQIGVSIYGPLHGSKVTEGMPAHVNQYFGRPNVHELVMAAAQGLSSESLAVVACGPATMADDARRAVVDALGRSHCCIEYFEEHFTW